jgi:K+-transporting ATPase ATPase A chain
LLYTYTSAAGTNGSAFIGSYANTPFYNLTLALAMLCGRFLVFRFLLSPGRSLRKKTVPVSAGTFPTDGMPFVFLLVGTVLIVGALTFILALVLGPLAEQFSSLQLH